jgi:hypothetical protein
LPRALGLLILAAALLSLAQMAAGLWRSSHVERTTVLAFSEVPSEWCLPWISLASHDARRDSSSAPGSCPAAWAKLAQPRQ